MKRRSSAFRKFRKNQARLPPGRQAGWALAKKLFDFRRRRKEFFLAVAGGCVDFLEIL